MIWRYQNHPPQTNTGQRVEEPHNTNSHKAIADTQAKQSYQISLPHYDCTTRMTQSTE